MRLTAVALLCIVNLPAVAQNERDSSKPVSGMAMLPQDDIQNPTVSGIADRGEWPELVRQKPKFRQARSLKISDLEVHRGQPIFQVFDFSGYVYPGNPLQKGILKPSGGHASRFGISEIVLPKVQLRAKVSDIPKFQACLSDFHGGFPGFRNLDRELAQAGKYYPRPASSQWVAHRRCCSSLRCVRRPALPTREWAIWSQHGSAAQSFRWVGADAGYRRQSTQCVAERKMTLHALRVFDGAANVGTLDYESLDEQFSFSYATTWSVAAASYSISPYILMKGAPAASSTVRRFVENLLPEGRALDIVSTTHQVSKNNVYGLIRELGQETSGALSFRQEQAPALAKSVRREVTRAELASRIAERTQIPFAVWDGRIRMSIAGYQDKLAVYMQDGRMYLVEGELASTHILKPEPQEDRLDLLVANEHFCMTLGERLGLRVAPVSILRLPSPVLVVERFDRMSEPGRVRRLHIIDGCQALNFPVSYKYERNFGSGRDVQNIREGVSFARLFSVAELTVQKAVTRLSLIRWALFQYLIGNSDAHGKNVSFYCRPNGLDLAPFYDLVSVVQYPHSAHELAMAFGDEFTIDAVRPYDWAAFARDTRTPRSLLAREMRRMGTNALQAAPALAASATYVDSERELVERIAEFVQTQAQNLLDMAGPTLQVEEESL